MHEIFTRSDSEEEEAEEVNGLIDDEGDLEEESSSLEDCVGDVMFYDSQDTTSQSGAKETIIKRKSRLKRIVDSDDEHDRELANDIVDRSRSDLRKNNDSGDDTDPIDFCKPKRRNTKKRISDSDDHNVSGEDLFGDNVDQNFRESNDRRNAPTGRRDESTLASNLTTCNKGLIEKQTTVNNATVKLATVTRAISSVDGIRAKPFGEKARNETFETRNQFINKLEQRIRMQNKQSSRVMDNDLDEFFSSQSDDDMFIPCFDLGLDIGPIDSEMIANAWKV